MEVFRAHGYFAQLWIFCSTSASLCRGWEVDWEWGWVSVVIVSIVCLRLPRRQQTLMERALALELVRSAFTSQLCPYLHVLGQIIEIFPRPILVIYKMGFVITELAVLV